MTAPKGEARGLHCRNCRKILDGRKTVWCSLACKREADTREALVNDIQTLVRRCVTCKLQKPLAADFYKLPNGTHWRQCRSCLMAANAERGLKPDVADKRRTTHLMGLYGITSSQYEELLRAQGGLCAVCRKPPIKKRLAVDHDHVTLLIRGLLCSHCNLRVVGKARNADIFYAAAEYLNNPPAVAALGRIATPGRPPKKRKPRPRRPPTRKATT